MRLRIISVAFLFSLFSSLVLSACQEIPLPGFSETVLNYPSAEVLFEVTIPSSIDDNTKIVLEFLDDVTGLAYNPTRLEMSKQDDRTYFLKTTITVGSLIKYRYLKQTENTIVEFTPQGNQVRFRLSQVDGPKVIKDMVVAWADEPYSGPLGRVRGQLTDASDQSPLPNMLVTAEGVSTITSSDGSFILEGLTPGTQNLVIMSMDGAYKVFEQGALIAEEATTPVFVSLNKRETVKVKFEVKLPNGIDPLLPLRIATNLYSLGNSYADHYAGTTNVAVNLPVLQRNALGNYEIELTLPVGLDLRYKFTLGDGFWNGELASNGAFVERQLIVPSKDTTIQNIVYTFSPAGTSPISFTLTVPNETPAEDVIDLQLNPFDWMGPIPMVRIDNTHWTYTLYNPQYFFPSSQYRYCRNNSCEDANEVTSDGKTRELTISNEAQTITDTVVHWADLSASSEPTTVTTENNDLAPRNDFLAGFELSKSMSVDNIAFLDTTFKNMNASGAKWVILDPTWTATRINPPLLEGVPGRDLLWNNWIEVAQKARQQNLNVGIYPRINFEAASNEYWSNAKKDSGWWQSWFDRYHRFIIQNADLSNMTGASAIFIGSPDLAPSMKDGKLINGDSSGVPLNADDQWRQLVQDIRSRFSGAVVGVIALPSDTESIPGWLDSVDAVYVQFTPVIDPSLAGSTSDLLGYFNKYLDEELLPLQERLNKPFLLGLNVRSSLDAYKGCVDQNGSCDEKINLEDGSQELDLGIQARIYNAAIISIASHTWIKGFISRNYQPVVNLQDTSTSVRGKPAADVLWYWYRYIGNISN